MYRYETHLHTFPVSKCAKADVAENLKFYKELGYDGVFITNHFLDGNINIPEETPYAEQLEFYFSDYEKAVELGKDLGLKVFCGVEVVNACRKESENKMAAIYAENYELLEFAGTDNHKASGQKKTGRHLLRNPNPGRGRFYWQSKGQAVPDIYLGKRMIL